MGKRLAVFAYGLVSYLVFFLTFVYAVGFIGNLYVPKSIDSATRMSFWAALFIDALLLLMFAVQHSVMHPARPRRGAAAGPRRGFAPLLFGRLGFGRLDFLAGRLRGRKHREGGQIAA